MVRVSLLVVECFLWALMLIPDSHYVQQGVLPILQMRKGKLEDLQDLPPNPTICGISVESGWNSGFSNSEFQLLPIELPILPHLPHGHPHKASSLRPTQVHPAPTLPWKHPLAFFQILPSDLCKLISPKGTGSLCSELS